jgi:hypothetical protein
MFTLLSVKILIYNNDYSTLIVTRIILRPLSTPSLDWIIRVTLIVQHPCKFYGNPTVYKRTQQKMFGLVHI